MIASSGATARRRENGANWIFSSASASALLPPSHELQVQEEELAHSGRNRAMHCARRQKEGR